MSEWKEIETVYDIPEPSIWGRFDWRGDAFMLQTNVSIKPDSISIKANGAIHAYEELKEYCLVAYKQKPLPPDDYRHKEKKE